MPEILVVRLHDRVVGQLRRGRDPSRVRLTIGEDFDTGLTTLTDSFTVIPGTEAPSDTVSNFLGGYVPEGNHRTVMASRRGVDPGDLFALLREFGGSLAGAVTVRPPGGYDGQPTAGWLADMSESGLADRLRQALRETDQAVPDDSRSTLPGFQPKVLACRAAGGWAQPHGAAHSTHILKPAVPGRSSRLVDEHYGHLLAQAAGLSGFASELLVADDVDFLAIQRFDRLVLPGPAVALLHQEDAAQALGLDWRTSEAKFQDPHWPDNPARASAGSVAQLLATDPGSATLLRDWVRRLVFSVALGDNDAHAKNIALLHTGQGTVLAPVYDAVPNLFARDMIDEGFRLAFAVNGAFDHRHVSADSLVAEVQSWRLIAPSVASAIVSDAVAVCTQAVQEVSPPDGVSMGLVDKLTWTVDRLAAGDIVGTSPWQAGKSMTIPRPRSGPASERTAGASRTDQHGATDR